MEHKISQMFFLRTSRKTKRNLTPIYLRITINGKRLEEAIHREIEYSEWSKIGGRMKGKSSSAEMINIYLDAIRTRVFDLEREMVFAGEIICYESFRNKWLGVKIAPKLILEIFEVHNEE